MRITLRQLAAVKPLRYLEPNTPTGLTGLFTHPAPRSQLIYLYTSTLQALSSFPSSSLYRQSVEALTNQRLEIVKSVVPEGYEAWATKAREVMSEHPDAFETPAGGVPFEGGKFIKETIGGAGKKGDGKVRGVFVLRKEEDEVDLDKDEWDGEVNEGPELEGVRTTEERRGQAEYLGRERPGSEAKSVELDVEPRLTVEQVEEIENKIGAGLIEEVIQVAEGELKLASILLEAKVWEDLEEKPVEGQWTYFPRDTATPTTQQPPQQK